ncbi:Thiosulfate sulfurtransferase/rhodanese-like domain-containing protein 3-like 1, partial [Homarus americanus]
MNWVAQLPRIVLKPGCKYCVPVGTKASRYFSSSPTLPPDVAFEELQQNLTDEKVMLIDVRTSKELNRYGKIPKSKNIGLFILGTHLLLPEVEFESQLGFKKPALDEPVIVSCLAGVRARTAQLAMIGAGYKNV